MAKLEQRDLRLFDYLPNYRFHLLDVSFSGVPVFNVSYGFARVSMPEISIEMKEIKEGVLEYKHYSVLSATVSPITLERGAVVFNNDFEPWCRSTISGKPNQRRNFLLVQFSDTGVPLINGTDTGQGNAAAEIVNQFVPIFDLFARIPARAWMLYGCLPVSYKAGSDLDALGNEISIQQVTVQPHYMSEIALGVL